MSVLLDITQRKEGDLFSSIEDIIEPVRRRSFAFKTLFRSARTYGQRELLADANMLGAEYVTVEETPSIDRRAYAGTATFYKFRTPLSFGDSTHLNTI